MAPNELQTNGVTAHDIAPIENLKISNTPAGIIIDGPSHSTDPHMHAKSDKKLKIPGRPRFATLEEERQHRKEHMAAAFRWMGMHGYGDEGGAGHISVRDPILTDHFWINPVLKSFRHMKVSDLVLVNEEGEVCEGGNMHAINAAGFQIHSAIHQARPDVIAACHAHSIAGKAFSTLGIELDITTQDACAFWRDHCVYKSHGVVLSSEEGQRIAKSLGQNSAVILQNHGLLTVGRTVDEAVAHFGAMDRCCAAQLLADAAAAGRGIKPTIIDDEDAKFTHDSLAGETMRYLMFMPAYEEVMEASKGEFLK